MEKIQRFTMPMRKMLTVLGLLLLLTASLGSVVSAAPAEAPAMQVNEEAGVLILSVVPDSPAAAAGVVRGDIVLAVDGEPVDSVDAFAAAIIAMDAGDEVTLTVLHGDDTLELPAILGERDGRAYLGVMPYAENAMRGEAMAGEDDGDVDEEADEDTADKEDAKEDDAIDGNGSNDADDAAIAQDEMMPFGALVADVVEDGPAATAGLVAGDLIVAVDGEALATDANLGDLIRAYAPGDEILLTVHNRQSNATMDVPVTLGAHPDDAERAYLGIAYTLTPAFADEDETDQENEADLETGNETGDMEEDEETAEDEDASVYPRRQLREMMSSGALVADVSADSPAADAGLVAGDLIVAVDGEELTAGANLGDLIAAYAPGDEIVLTVRNHTSNETLEIPVTLGAHPDDAEKAFLGIAYMPAPGISRYERLSPPDGNKRFHGNKGFGNQGDMLPFFGPGMDGHMWENFDLDQLSEEDRDALQQIFPFLFPDLEPQTEGELEGEGGI